MELTFNLTAKDIRIRDPFVLPVSSELLYYMYSSGTTFGRQGLYLMAYRSRDLVHWSEPIKVFEPSPDFWSKCDYWAPEVHQYKGKYYLFMSFRADGRHRGTQILRADSPAGPFLPISDGPMTPSNWECLDGTLYVEDGKPYMVFCHEWTQVADGSFWAIPLKDDLTGAAGRPFYMFSSSEAPWVIGWEKNNLVGFPQKSTVSDGAWLYRNSTGRLFMLWSSFGKNDYTVGLAESSNGRLYGEWTQYDKPIFEGGGHCMTFRDFNGQLRLILHSPNHDELNPRPCIFNLIENDEGLPEISQ